MRPILVLFLLITMVFCATAEAEKPLRPYHLPKVSIKNPIIWGSQAKAPDGFTLAFGGQHQRSPDGRPHTRIKTNGPWRPIVAELRDANPLQPFHSQAWAIRQQIKAAAAKARYLFFQDASAQALTTQVLAPLRKAATVLRALTAELDKTRLPDPYRQGQLRYALDQLTEADKVLKNLLAQPQESASAALLKDLWKAQLALEQGAEALDAEPPARALSPLIYEPDSGLFVMFGGDHLDYLTNDTWVFDRRKMRWEQRHPETAPPPRANHTLIAISPGQIELSGGYTYFNDVYYMSGAYRDSGDGRWIYDIAENRWSGTARGATNDVRTYRGGLFHPLGYLRGRRPDANAHEAKLKALPVNRWVRMKPPHRFPINRDWGTAVIDPDRDLLLFFSGGHSAHGGSDVMMYHFATNRWELPFPVELPLGQLYSNVAYPRGYNFNLRPWMTVHTYKNYGYDPLAKAMIFTGQRHWFYVFDPDVGDWVGRGRKPKLMNHNTAPMFLTCVRTPAGLTCLTPDADGPWGAPYGQIFRYNSAKASWQQLRLKGKKLIGPKADHSGLVYDSRRNRLLVLPKQESFSRRIYSVDLNTNTVAKLHPANPGRAKGIRLLFREMVYVPEADLAIVLSAMLPPRDGVRQTLAYDCANNRWVSLNFSGANPAGGGANISMGAAYDSKRGLIWATDAESRIFVLRPDFETAGSSP